MALAGTVLVLLSLVLLVGVRVRRRLAALRSGR